MFVYEITNYHISTQLETNNPVKLLLNDLVEAEERGVQVRIYLNTKFRDVSYEELISEDDFKMLKEAGCEVYFIPLLIKELLEKEGKDLGSVPQKEIMRRFHIAERTLEKALADLKNR